jgi:hypothetical protein
MTLRLDEARAGPNILKFCWLLEEMRVGCFVLELLPNS